MLNSGLGTMRCAEALPANKPSAATAIVRMVRLDILSSLCLSPDTKFAAAALSYAIHASIITNEPARLAASKRSERSAAARRPASRRHVSMRRQARQLRHPLAYDTLHHRAAVMLNHHHGVRARLFVHGYP